MPYRVVSEEGDAFKLMQAHARYHDLTIFGLRSIFEYYFEDVDSSKLLARLVGGGVRPIMAVSREVRPIRRVLVAYSGSIGSASTLRQLIHMRPWPEAALRIVHFGDGSEEGEKALGRRRRLLPGPRRRGEDSRSGGLVPRRPAGRCRRVGRRPDRLGQQRPQLPLGQLFGETTLNVIQERRPAAVSLAVDFPIAS